MQNQQIQKMSKATEQLKASKVTPPTIDIDAYLPKGNDVVIKLLNPNAAGLHLDENTMKQIAFSKSAYYPVIVVGPEQKDYIVGQEVFVLPSHVMNFVQQGIAVELPTEDKKHWYMQIPASLIVGRRL